jgi:hypothetical protein
MTKPHFPTRVAASSNQAGLLNPQPKTLAPWGRVTEGPENLRPVAGVPHARRCPEIVEAVVSDQSTDLPERLKPAASHLAEFDVLLAVWNLWGNTLGSTAGRG